MTVNPKVSAAGFAGAVTVVFVWLVGMCGVVVPAEVASAITTLVMFWAGYFRRSD